MKNKNISEMTKEERKTHLLMLINSYKHLYLYDVIDENKFGERIWKTSYKNAVRIYINIMKMEGKSFSTYNLT